MRRGYRSSCVVRSRVITISPRSIMCTRCIIPHAVSHAFLRASMGTWAHARKHRHARTCTHVPALADMHCRSYESLLDGLYPRTPAQTATVLLTVQTVPPQVAAEANPTQQMFLARLAQNGRDDGVCLSESFLNHSCKPNCEIQSAYHSQIFAVRDIEAGEELTIAYMQLQNLVQPQEAQQSVQSDLVGALRLQKMHARFRSRRTR